MNRCYSKNQSFFLPDAKIIMKAPKNSTIHPHFSCTMPANLSCHDVKGIKLKYCEA